MLSSTLGHLSSRAARYHAFARTSRRFSKLIQDSNRTFPYPPRRVSSFFAAKPVKRTLVMLNDSFARPYSTASDPPTEPRIPIDPDTSNERKDPTVQDSPPPSYELTFTCKPCKHRSKHNITKQGYHYGAVLITCPNCKNRHIISDHMGIFRDKATTLEDLLKQKGELVKRGTLSSEGDVEFWDDGTTTERTKLDEANAEESPIRKVLK